MMTAKTKACEVCSKNMIHTKNNVVHLSYPPKIEQLWYCGECQRYDNAGYITIDMRAVKSDKERWQEANE